MQLGDGLMRQRDDTGRWITGHCSHAGTGGCWSGLAELSHCSGDAPSSFPGERPRRAIHVDRPTSFSAKGCAGAVSGRVCFACVAIGCRGSSCYTFSKHALRLCEGEESQYQKHSPRNKKVVNDLNF